MNRLIACLAIVAVFAALIWGIVLGRIIVDALRSDPVETHRACYEESFGAGTVPTSEEIPCP